MIYINVIYVSSLFLSSDSMYALKIPAYCTGVELSGRTQMGSKQAQLGWACGAEDIQLDHLIFPILREWTEWKIMWEG